MNKPVTCGVTDAELDDLPEETHRLVEDLQTLYENAGIIPSKMQVRWSTRRFLSRLTI
jgi:hypothetical protein